LIKEYDKKLINDKTNFRNYKYYDINLNDFPYLNILLKCVKEYKEMYPEINQTASYWQLTSPIRYKVWEKGSYYSDFHSEHSIVFPNRVLSLQLYLTSHSCGTEFFDKTIIKSEIGKVCIFPAYFTHTHKGQPDINKNRSIITGYVEFVEKGPKEWI